MKEVTYSVNEIIALGLETKVALITDGRFSVFNQGPIIGHVSPEAIVGGPIALLRDGDTITIDIPGRKLNVNLTTEEIEKRTREWIPIEPRVKKGFLKIYAKLASQADRGAAIITQEIE